MMRAELNAFILAARLKTLSAAASPVVLGSAMAWRHGGFDAIAASLCLAFALLIQIGTNYANDYYDFVKGADTSERKGPTRAVASGLISPAVMKRAFVLIFLLAFFVGSLLIPYGGWALIGVGVASILAGIAYTGGPYPLAYNGLGDLFVFIFFGLVAVLVTDFVQSGMWSWESFLMAFVPGAASTNLLLVNNYRDYETDRQTGKRTLVVIMGRRFARLEFTLLHLSVYGVALYGVWGWEKVSFLLPLMLLPYSLKMRRQLKEACRREDFDRLLVAAAKYLVASTILFAVAIII